MEDPGECVSALAGYVVVRTVPERVCDISSGVNLKGPRGGRVWARWLKSLVKKGEEVRGTDPVRMCGHKLRRVGIDLTRSGPILGFIGRFGART